MNDSAPFYPFTPNFFWQISYKLAPFQSLSTRHVQNLGKNNGIYRDGKKEQGSLQLPILYAKLWYIVAQRVINQILHNILI